MATPYDLAKSALQGGTYNSVLPTLADGEVSPLQLDQFGRLLLSSVATIDRPVYSAGAASFAIAATATDIFRITGSATKVVRVRRVSVDALKTGTHVSVDLLLLKRVTANTGGTVVAMTPTRHDSSLASATATPNIYTSNPTTLGTLEGMVRSQRIAVQGTTEVRGEVVSLSNLSDVVLRGVNESLVLSLNGDTVANSTWWVDVEWSEE